MPTTFNQSLAHGLQILLLYDTVAPMFSVAEMSRRLGYGESKTYRLVRPLIRFGFLQEVSGTGLYSLGVNALKIGLLAQQAFNLPAIALPLMKELSGLTKETVVLTGVNGTKGMVLDRVESEEPVRYSLFQPGASIPLHAGASSKVLMAYLPEEKWDEIIAKEGLQRYTEKTITDEKELKTHLRKIRERGYGFSDQEVDREVRGVAAPIFNALGEMLAGLSVVGPAYRMNKRKISEIRRQVIEYTGKISARLGYERRGAMKVHPDDFSEEKRLFQRRKS
jgi:IclR family KDG regulon transcriptional repressor